MRPFNISSNFFSMFWKQSALSMIIFFCVIAASMYGQQAKKNTAPVFKQYFFVEVSGLKSEIIAKQMTDQILKDSRFFSCKTDWRAQSITISAGKGVRIEDVKYYTSMFNLVITRFREKYSTGSLQEFLNGKD